MRTKFIKVSTADRLPEKEGVYFISSNSTAYEDERKSFFNGTRFIDKYGSNMHVEYWLDERPDYEEEMKEFIQRVSDTMPSCSSLHEKAKALLTKLKTES